MKTTLFASALILVSIPAMTMAGAIENACLRSDRAAASRAICGCIQQVADLTLRSNDQRKAAKLFQDPEQAQKIRMSKSGSDNQFWARYKNFGETAQAYCAG